ncbi:guanine nucleotide-binding protein subunit alpha-14-like isoform X1 [Schistocerca piceifrons]|uniref:guanine nucleotide-binding protein subunit alpha-14-like isoform X1 n=1 Tax=Schistocerca piceifrons TaxID=274613 RepID=UPI001F5ECD3B|nr:guanine nucleotide-binding protein subunit alpha-14-like isoform X1 [Schistocerca piceifrons]
MEDDGCCYRDALSIFLANRRLTIEVQRERELYRRLRARDVKTLLLGCGSSGKSTFMKQVRIIEEGGLTEEERKTFKPVICQNVITSTQMLIMGMQLYELQYESKKSEECAKMIMELEVREVTELNATVLAAVKQLWRDSGIQACYKRRDELYLLDSTKYFMRRLDVMSAPDYIPTEQDVLRSRSPTSGVIEYRLPIQNYDKKLCIVDVGGQRSERPKWVHCFENCVAFIFISAISEYNQLNERGQNRVSESLALFKVLLTCSAFRYTSVIVFLNKVDIFDEKIKKHHLSHYFPEYKGPKKDPESAKEFFAEKFQKCCHDVRKSVYVRYTCATDTENMSAVFSTVRDFITKRMMLQFNVQ